MLECPKYWLAYYHGTEEQIARKRMFSLSDRIRYYWSEPRVQKALNRLLTNLFNVNLSPALMQINEVEKIISMQKLGTSIKPESIILANIHNVLDSYAHAVAGRP